VVKNAPSSALIKKKKFMESYLNMLEERSRNLWFWELTDEIIAQSNYDTFLKMSQDPNIKFSDMVKEASVDDGKMFIWNTLWDVVDEWTIRIPILRPYEIPKETLLKWIDPAKLYTAEELSKMPEYIWDFEKVGNNYKLKWDNETLSKYWIIDKRAENEIIADKIIAENKVIEKSNVWKANDTFFKNVEQTAQTEPLKKISAYEKTYNLVSGVVEKILPC
jgi:hypothetical protein